MRAGVQELCVQAAVVLCPPTSHRALPALRAVVSAPLDLAHGQFFCLLLYESRIAHHSDLDFCFLIWLVYMPGFLCYAIKPAVTRFEFAFGNPTSCAGSCCLRLLPMSSLTAATAGRARS